MIIIIIITDSLLMDQNESGGSKILVPIPETNVHHIQRAWDAPIVNSVLSTIMASAVTDVAHARLNALHSGDWLRRPSIIASLGLKL